MSETEHPPSADHPAAILDAVAGLLASRDFHSLTLGEVAAAAGLTLVELRGYADGKPGLLALFHRTFNEALWQAPPADPEESVRDRLFDAVMRRFDAMRPYRAAIDRINRALCRDPLLLACGAGGLMKTAALTLEVSGISASGPLGLIRTQAIAALYVRVIGIWIDDEEADMGKTMAALDRGLRRLEQLARLTGQF